MFNDDLMKKTNNNRWQILMWIIILSSLIYMIFTDNWRSLYKEEVLISVYLDANQCTKEIENTLKHLCLKSEQYSMERSNTVVWPYKNKINCEKDFGSCKETNNQTWSPFNLAFAIVKNDKDYQPFPIYYSLKHKRYMISSGYPVVIGKNRLPYFPKDKQYLVTVGGNFSQKICFNMSDGNKACRSRNEMLDNLNSENLNMLMHSVLGQRK